MGKKLAVLLLILAMTPAVSELFEVSLHLVRYGDLAHAGGDHHSDESPNDEHGCSQLFHLCSCHRNITPIVVTVPRITVGDSSPIDLVLDRAEETAGLEDPEPLLQPPIPA